MCHSKVSSVLAGKFLCMTGSRKATGNVYLKYKKICNTKETTTNIRVSIGELWKNKLYNYDK